MSPEERRQIEARMAELSEPDLTDADHPEWTEETFARAVPVDDLPPHLQAAILVAFPRTKLRGRQKAPGGNPGSMPPCGRLRLRSGFKGGRGASAQPCP